MGPIEAPALIAVSIHTNACVNGVRQREHCSLTTYSDLGVEMKR